MSEIFAKSKCWINPYRLGAELQQNGSVVYPEDVTTDELKEIIKILFHEIEIRRKQALKKMLGVKK